MLVPSRTQILLFLSQISVEEEARNVRLLIVRAQGLTGFVSVEYRTVDKTARSVGKVPPDYLVSK